MKPSKQKHGYLILMPMRNELASIETTLQSVVSQTIKPIALIVLSDGSTDGSNEVVQKYADTFPWIELHLLADRGFDLVGQGVAQVLNYGLNIVSDISCEYIVKLDADLNLPANYFEHLIFCMDTDPTLGVVSGHPFTYENGKKFLERHGDHFPSGTARLYRRSVLSEIGNFTNSVGWDTVDLLRMDMRGYSTKVIHELEYHHMRRMGTRNGYIDGMIRDGRNAYLTGYSPIYFLCRAIFNMKFRPYLLRTICMLLGFVQAYSRRLPRVVNSEEMTYHRKIQHDRLLLKSAK